MENKDYNQIAEEISRPDWKWMYIIVRPDPFGTKFVTDGQNRCYEIKLGDGRENSLVKTYSTYSGEAKAIQFQVHDDIATGLPEHGLKDTAGLGVAKVLERAFFDGVEPQQSGFVKTEWYALKTVKPDDNQNLTTKLQILLNAFADSGVSTDNTSGTRTLTNLVVLMQNVTLLCGIKRSPGVGLITKPGN